MTERMLEDEPNLLPVPLHLEPKATKHALGTSVRRWCLACYNGMATFRRFAQSVNNETAKTKRLAFDHLRMVDMIKEAGKKGDDAIVANAAEGRIWPIIRDWLKENHLGIRGRQREYARLTHSAPAE